MPAEAPDATLAARIDLLRHGHVAGPDCLRGWQDDPLDATGWQQMRQAVASAGPWQRIVSSPLQRCAAFAQALADEFGLPLETDPRWRELSFGDWEGRSIAAIQADSPRALQAFWDNPERHPPPGGETLSALQRRCVAAWDALHSPAGSRTLLVCHGGVIRVLLCHLLGLPTAAHFRFEIAHAALISLLADPDYPRLYLGGPTATTRQQRPVATDSR